MVLEALESGSFSCELIDTWSLLLRNAPSPVRICWTWYSESKTNLARDDNARLLPQLRRQTSRNVLVFFPVLLNIMPIFFISGICRSGPPVGHLCIIKGGRWLT
jgi:hypothetical protein